MQNIDLPKPYRTPSYFQAYRFKVEIDHVFAAAFSRVSSMGLHVDTLPYRVGTDASTAPGDVPALTHFENVTFTRGIVGDYDMLQWIWSTGANDSNAPTGVQIKRNITVTMLKEDGTDGPRWFINDAIPVSYRVEDMDSLNGEVLMESLEVSCSGFTRETTAGYDKIHRTDPTVQKGAAYSEARANYIRRMAQGNGGTGK